MKLECPLQDVLEVLTTGLMKWLPRVPLGYFESGIRALRALGFNRNVPEPFRHSQSGLAHLVRLIARHFLQHEKADG
jgi:hypothetical protein